MAAPSRGLHCEQEQAGKRQEETKAGKLNDSVSSRLKSKGSNPQGGPKAQNGVQKEKGGGEPPRKETPQSMGAQEEVQAIKEMLEEMLVKMEISLKVDISTLR